MNPFFILMNYKIVILFFAVSSFIYPQNNFKNFFNVGVDIYSAPFRFENDDWINLSLITATTGAGILLDKPVKSLFLRNKNDVADFIFEIDKYFYIEGAAAGIIAAYAYGAIENDERIKNLGVQLAEASFYASTITLLTKALLGRKRPNSNCGCSSFNPFTTDVINSSLPSAHSTLAFAFSTVMANYKDDIAWKISWYTLATLVGFARIYHNAHWFSDVVLGAAIGYFVGGFVSNHELNKVKEIPPPDVIPGQKVFFIKLAF